MTLIAEDILTDDESALVAAVLINSERTYLMLDHQEQAATLSSAIQKLWPGIEYGPPEVR